MKKEKITTVIILVLHVQDLGIINAHNATVKRIDKYWVQNVNVYLDILILENLNVKVKYNFENID